MNSSTAIRIGAAFTVLAVHAAVVGAIYWSSDEEPPQLLEPDAVMVSVIEAPVPQIAKAEPAIEPQPESQPEPEPEPEPEVVPPEPEPEVVPPEPEPEPEVVPPEPEPIVPPPPEPEPAPAPKPKPKPKPKPTPKPETPKPVTKPQPPKPKPVAEPSQTPPSGNPEGDRVTQAPVQAPPPDQPIMMTNVEYVGRRPVPDYPSISRRFREEGRVVVLVEISTAGVVDKASIDTSSGFSRLDESALVAARKARFKPLTRNGVAYPAKAKLPFDFVIRK